MRYDDQDSESSNVEDRRGQGGGGFRFPGGGGNGIQIPIGGGMSLTTLLIIGGIMLLFGINPLDILRGGIGGDGGGFNVPQMPRSERTSRPSADDIPGLPGSPGKQQAGTPKSGDDQKVFIGRVLKDTEDVWSRVFQSFGKKYTNPQLVLFSGGTRTACGVGQSAMGPFYCPIDQKIYVDLAFYDELSRRFKAPGDFAQAYVIAHEVGHHVQLQLGIAEKVQELKERSGDERQANALQVRMELQADCLAGVWANLNNQMKNRLQDGDIEEGLNAASQIGDDMIQRKTQGRVVPDAFTHGSSAQRTRWFKQGFESGQMQSCDTFNAQDL
ncbi:MAG: neutral zinc metallopeptidase [Hyphomicrobiaceae bacterium]|nr:neutral zinc metallopeptidase [Hyphomicrobiaceae bacterium]